MSAAQTRTEAIARGLPRYHTGKPCPHGHIADRFVSNKSCHRCIAIAREARHKRFLVVMRAYHEQWRN